MNPAGGEGERPKTPETPTPKTGLAPEDTAAPARPGSTVHFAPVDPPNNPFGAAEEQSSRYTVPDTGRTFRTMTERESDAPRPPKMPDPERYDGQDPHPKAISTWGDEVETWLQGSGVNPDSIFSFYYIAGFLSGEAKRYFFETLAPKMKEYRRRNPQARNEDPSPFPLTRIIEKLSDKFVSKTAYKDAEARFLQLTQYRNGEFITVPTLAAELERLSTEMQECSELRLKKQFLEAIDEDIALKIQDDVTIERSPITYEELVEMASRYEQTATAKKALARAKREGRHLTRYAAQSTSVQAEEERRTSGSRNTRDPSWRPQERREGPPRNNQRIPPTPRKNNNYSNRSPDNDRRRRDADRNERQRVSQHRRDNNLCYSCGEKGHYLSNCPKRTGGQGHMSVKAMTMKDENEPVVATGGARIFAQAMGRIVPDAQRETGEALELAKLKVQEGNPETEKGEPPFLITVTEVGGLKTNTLWDTAASDNFISPAHARCMKEKPIPYDTPLKLGLGTRGSSSKINHYLELPVFIPELNLKSVERFNIANLSNQDVYLGSRFIAKHEIRLALRPPSLEFVSDNDKEDLSLAMMTLAASEMKELTETDPEYDPTPEEISRFREDL
jgi:hypothetical protein